MTGFPLIIAFVAAIALMILAISRFKVHPFLSIMGVSLILGGVAGIPIVDVTLEDGSKISGLASVISSGFSGTFSSIGVVIILGALIGSVLEATGAALKLADMVIRLIGKRRPVLALELMGWVVSIPVFCDSGFVILNPIRKALVRRTGESSVAMSVGLSSGLYLSHVFIPPTPGPIAAANTLGVGDNLLMVMGFGVVCSIFPLITGYFYSNFVGKRIRSADEADAKDVARSYEELINEYGKLPCGLDSMAPIIIPVILMALSSTASMVGTTGIVKDLLTFLGTPIIALIVGTIFAVIQLNNAGKMERFYDLTNDALKTVGPILFVTAAGGVLGKVIASSDMVNYVTQHASVLQTMGIFFPFILSAILKSAQGSSTVALTTTAGIVAPLLPILGLSSPIGACLSCMAIGAGAMTVSHANDSFFWVVANFGAMTPEQGYKTQTVNTLVLGLSAMIEVFLLSLVLR